MDSKRDWFWKMLLEVTLIGVAVFLGMAADQWRTDRQHRAQAQDALARFRTEITANKAAVADTRDYHLRIREEIGNYFSAAPDARKTVTMNVNRGIAPANFEHTAWDLALATQALADIEPGLAFEIARLYGAQEVYNVLTTGLTNAMYTRPPSENMDGLLRSMQVWLADIVRIDAALLTGYDRVLPMIDAATSH